jgi:hypothetical protein
MTLKDNHKNHILNTLSSADTALLHDQKGVSIIFVASQIRLYSIIIKKRIYNTLSDADTAL